jgi:heme-degrading monooxygenase HmoA
MIVRIVKLTFAPEHTASFIELFKGAKEKILSFEGCSHVELLQGAGEENIMFTYSYWESEDALDAYRHSDFFATTWKKTKQLFSDKAEAWSLNKTNY